MTEAITSVCLRLAMALIFTAFGQTSTAYESVVNSNEKYLFLLQSSTNLAMLLHN